MKFPLKQVQNNQNPKKLFLTNLIKKKNRSEDLHNFEAWMFKLQELISIMKKKNPGILYLSILVDICRCFNVSYCLIPDIT